MSLRTIEERLAAEPLEERKATVGLDPKRAGVIVAGFVILEEVLALAGAVRLHGQRIGHPPRHDLRSRSGNLVGGDLGRPS